MDVLRILENKRLEQPDDEVRECDYCGMTHDSQGCELPIYFYKRRVVCYDCLKDEGMSDSAIAELRKYDRMYDWM